MSVLPMNSLLWPKRPIKSLTWSQTSTRMFLHSLVSEITISKVSFHVGTRDLLATLDSYREEPAANLTNAEHRPLQSEFTSPLASWSDTYSTPIWAFLCPGRPRGVASPLTSPAATSLPPLLLSPLLLFPRFLRFLRFSLSLRFLVCLVSRPRPPWGSPPAGAAAFSTLLSKESRLSVELVSPALGTRLCGLEGPARPLRAWLPAFRRLGIGVLTSSSTSAPRSASSLKDTY
mmetsp:Transcript_485/g.1928  ORF Transcript_485/g.1928 Transcript_485/m.1928 type:complete len:232 (-) Transcript_485:1402-2097(-)